MAIFIPSMVTFGAVRRFPWWNQLNVAVGHWTLVNILRLPEHSPPQSGAEDLALMTGTRRPNVPFSAPCACAESGMSKR
jgi:hypothetical protein